MNVNIRIENGKPKLTDKIYNYCRRFKDGNYVLFIRKPGRLRSKEQNDKYAVWIGIIAIATGNSVAKVRETFRDDLVRSINPDVHSSADLTVEEFNRLMELVKLFAHDYEIYLE